MLDVTRPSKDRSRRALLLLVMTWGTLAAAACSTTGSQSRPARDRSLITREELEAYDERSAYVAVERLRPGWLLADRTANLRGAGSVTPQVIVDGMHRGGLETLRTLMAREIEELRFLSSSDASTRYGTGYPAGAIVIKTRGRP